MYQFFSISLSNIYLNEEVITYMKYIYAWRCIRIALPHKYVSKKKKKSEIINTNQ